MHANRQLKRAGLLVAAIFAIAYSANSLRAQEVVKANNTTSLVDGGSWVGGTAPTSSNVIVWNSTVTGSNSPDLGGNFSVAGIKVTNPSGVVGINSSTINSGAVTANSSVDTFTYSGADVAAGNVVSFSHSSGAIPGGLVSGQLYFIVNVDTVAKTYQVAQTAGGTPINFTSNGSNVSNSVRSALSLGGSGIDMSAATQNLAVLAAPVSLTANQTWTIASGRRIDSNNNANFTGVDVLNNGYLLTIDGGGVVDLGSFLGSGGITKNGSGSLVMMLSTYDFAGDLTINAGSVNLKAVTSIGGGGSRLVMNGGTLTAQSNNTRTFGRDFVVAGDAAFYNNNSTNGGAQSYSFATLSIGDHAFAVTANGSGTGSLTFGATTLTGNPTFDVGSRDSNFLILGAVGETGGARGFTKSGVGTLRLTGASTYSGTTTITGGIVEMTGVGSLPAAGAVVNDATLSIGGIGGASTTIGGLSGSGSVLLGGKTLVFDGSGDASFSGTITGSTGAVTKQGTGFQTLAGANAYGGTTTISQGGLVIASTGALPGWNAAGRFSVANGASLAVSNSISDADVATLLGTGNFAAGSRIGFDTTAGDRTYGDVIADTGSGALGLTKVGGNALSLSGVNTFSGGLAVADGSLSISSINDAGSNGTLGSGLSAVVLGSSGKQGTLSYTGATGSSSRAFSAAAGGTAAFEVTDSASTLTLSGLINGDGDKTFGGPGNFLLSGGFDGTGGVFKTGAGAMTLAGPGHAGNFSITEGRLNINAANALGDSSGSLSLGNGVSLDNTSGSLVTIGNSKPISLGSSLNFLGSNSLGMGNGTVTLSGNTAIDVAANALAFGGDVVGAGYGITKTGTGTLVLGGLSGASSFTGNTHIQGGRIQLSGLSVLGGGSSTVVTIDEGAYLDVGPTASVGNVTINTWTGGLITGTTINANVTYSASGSLTTSDSLVNGVQTIGAGVVVSASADLFGTDPGAPTAGRIVMQDNARMRATTGFTMSANKGIQLNSGTATFESASGQFVLPNSISGAGALIKTGTGGFRVTGGNSYEGGTIVQQGTFGIASDASLGAVTGRLLLDGGTVNSAQDSTTVTINAARQIVLANGKTSGIDANPGGTIIYAGAIGEDDPLGAQVGSLRIGTAGRRDGTVILGGSNTYRGTTTVAAGTLVVNGSLGQGNLTVDSGATLKGSGTINGFTSIQGTHSPGNSPGLETFTNGLTYGSSSTLVWELSANTSLSADRGTLYDGINLTNGSLTIDPGAKIDLVFNAALAGGGPSTVDWDDPFWASSQSWKVIDLQSGLWSGGLFTLSAIGADASGQALGSSVRSSAMFSLRQDNSGVYVEYVIVPEPDTAIFAGVGIAMAGWSLWKRRRIARILRK